MKSFVKGLRKTPWILKAGPLKHSIYHWLQQELKETEDIRHHVYRGVYWSTQQSEWIR